MNLYPRDTASRATYFDVPVRDAVPGTVLRPIQLKTIGKAAKIFLMLVLSAMIPSLLTAGSWLLLACLDGTCSLATALSNIQEDPKILTICILSGQISFIFALVLLIATFICRQISVQTKQVALAQRGNRLALTAWVSLTMSCLVLFHWACFI